jgi:cation transport ATPase
MSSASAKAVNASDRGRQNLVWAVLYNVIAFPLGAGVLYPKLLDPEIAALSTSGARCWSR